MSSSATESAFSRLIPPVRGGPRDIGRALGTLGRAAWSEYMARSPAWRDLQPWRNHARLQALADATRAYFPKYWEEIVGLAEGLGISREDCFLWNCRGDLLHKSRDGCTSVAANCAAGRWIAHNEDGDPLFRPSWRIVELKPDDAPGILSFCYPGSLVGHTFGVNQIGLVQTVNNLRTAATEVGVPRMILSRAVLGAQTLDDAIGLLRDKPRAGGFHHFLGQAGDRRIFSVEAVPGGFSLLPIGDPYGHANHAIHQDLVGIPQVITQSSKERQERISVLAAGCRAICDEAALTAILGDEEGGRLPIYRDDPRDPDDENTLATAVFAIGETDVRFWTFENQGSALLSVRIAVTP